MPTVPPSYSNYSSSLAFPELGRCNVDVESFIDADAYGDSYMDVGRAADTDPGYTPVLEKDYVRATPRRPIPTSRFMITIAVHELHLLWPHTCRSPRARGSFRGVSCYGRWPEWRVGWPYQFLCVAGDANGDGVVCRYTDGHRNGSWDEKAIRCTHPHGRALFRRNTAILLL